MQSQNVISLLEQNGDIKEQISKRIHSAKEIFIAVAFLKKSGLDWLIKDIENFIEKGGSLTCYIGTNFYITDPKALTSLLKISKDNSNCILFIQSSSSRRQNGKTFHPKVYCLQAENNFTAIVGSSNLTNGGLIQNIEGNVVIECNSSEKLSNDFQRFFQELSESQMFVKLPDKEEISQYSSDYKKYHKKVKKAEKEAMEEISKGLTLEQRKMVTRKIKKIKKDYLKWLEKTNQNEERINYLEKVKNYATNQNWISLLAELWTIKGLKRGALAKINLRSNNSTEIAKNVIKLNNSENLKSWIDATRTDENWNNIKNIKLELIADKIKSELLCVFHGDKYGIMNDIAEKALLCLLGECADNFPYKKYEYMPYLSFNTVVREIGDIYCNVVKQQCPQIPLLLEVDALFWYLKEIR